MAHLRWVSEMCECASLRPFPHHRVRCAHTASDAGIDTHPQWAQHTAPCVRVTGEKAKGRCGLCGLMAHPYHGYATADETCTWWWRRPVVTHPTRCASGSRSSYKQAESALRAKEGRRMSQLKGFAHALCCVLPRQTREARTCKPPPPSFNTRRPRERINTMCLGRLFIRTSVGARWNPPPSPSPQAPPSPFLGRGAL